MPSDTPDQQITLPIGADVADNPVAFTNFVADVEQRLVRLYASEADRTARRASVAENQISALADLNRVDIYDGTNDISLYSRSFFVHARLTANHTFTQNITTMQDVTGLVAAMPTAGTFGFKGFIIYSSSTVADLKLAFTFPAGGTLAWSGLGVVTGAAGTGDGAFNVVSASDSPIGYGGNGVGVSMSVRIEGTYVAGGTAGNLQLRGAQNTGELTNTVIHTGSRLQVWRAA